MSAADPPLASAAPSWRALAITGAGILALCLALIAWVDEPLALLVHTYDQTLLGKIFAVITELGNSTIWYVLALAGMSFAFLRARGQPGAEPLLRQRLRAGLFLIVTLAISGLLINGLKLVIGRARPPVLFKTGAAQFHPMSDFATSWSFPSGHSQSIWAAMAAVAWIYPPLRVPCFVLAVLVSVSRVIVGAHFLSDVIAGAFLAVAVAVIVRRAFERGGISINLQTPSGRGPAPEVLIGGP
jgi:membrane-associated phospholipid phosphatase